MSDKAQSTEQAETPSAHRGILDENLGRLRNALIGEGADAFARYGFALFHSLPADEQILHKEAMGMAPRDATDHYNLGVAYAMREQYDKALTHWRTAFRQDPELHQALFNMAVLAENAGKMADARKHYQAYCEAIDDADEAEQVRSHLAEIGG